eukprot:6903362-Pyramimonas_sp.AAC.1
MTEATSAPMDVARARTLVQVVVCRGARAGAVAAKRAHAMIAITVSNLSLIHISEPTRPEPI